MGASVSIVIATHNRVFLLAEALASLARVEVSEGVEVELVVVANACSDGTEQMVGRMARALPFPVRCVEEPLANLSVARNRGVREATGDILAFLDDDVLVEPGWLRGLVEVYRTVPADVVGGRVTLNWKDVERPEWFSPRHETMLGRCELGDQVCELRNAAFIGANLSCRRRVLEALHGFTPGLGPTGRIRFANEERELMTRALQQGFRFFYAPQAAVLHRVQVERIDTGYLCRAKYGQARSKRWISDHLPRRGLLCEVVAGVAGCLGDLALAGLFGACASKRRCVEHRVHAHYNLGKMMGALDRLRSRFARQADGHQQERPPAIASPALTLRAGRHREGKQTLIPRKIHCCWFGGNPKDSLVQKCQQSWQTVMPDYEIKEWTEENSPMDVPYVQQAYSHRLWNMVSDYVRLHALYVEGGIYLDTDVEAVRRFDALLHNDCFLGFQRKDKARHWVNNAVMGATAKHPFTKACLEQTVKGMERTLQGHIGDSKSYISPQIITEVLLEMGLKAYGMQALGNVRLCPTHYFYPFRWDESFRPKCVTESTYCIHHWQQSCKERRALGRCSRHASR
jgi:mannosyltransferase OCH1-like enzyme/glycosyltransferase involved in cell wall biosynthesis